MIALLRNLIFKDFWLKLFSLALAVLTWFTIRIAIEKEVSPVGSLVLSTTAQVTFPNLPVVILSSGQDVRNFKVNPPEVEVTVQGDVKALRTLRSKDIRVLVDLTGINAAGDMHKRIEVSTPAGVTHVRIDPDEVRVLLPPKS
jgi:YbbR domain-containing protein